MSLTPCHRCGYHYNLDACGIYGCPNCHGQGLDDILNCLVSFDPNGHTILHAAFDRHGTPLTNIELKELQSKINTNHDNPPSLHRRPHRR